MECVELKKIRVWSFPPNLNFPSNLDRESLFHNTIWDTISIRYDATLYSSAHFSLAFHIRKFSQSDM